MLPGSLSGSQWGFVREIPPVLSLDDNLKQSTAANRNFAFFIRIDRPSRAG
jgi:hypothetical protein